MHALLKVGETEILSFLNPDSVIGALIYLVLFVTVALILSRVQRRVLHAAMTRKGHLIDLTTISFLQQFGSALIWVIMLDSVRALDTRPALDGYRAPRRREYRIGGDRAGRPEHVGQSGGGHFYDDLPAIPTG